MKLHRVPSLAEARALLAEARLGSSDLTAAAMETFLCVELDGSLVALGGLEILGDHAFLLRSVATSPSHRGRGLASELVDALEALARERGVSELFLLTETAERFFAGRGFACCDRQRAPVSLTETSQFRELCPASATLMVKRLEPR